MIELMTPPAEPLTHDQCLQAAKYMCFRGGSFAGAIGDAYIFADSVNRPRVLAAFPELFARYAKETA